MKYKLKVIVGSTRPGRKGIAVANWFMNVAQEHPEFEVELLDLKEINLPMMDEAEHPRLQKYTHEHTRQWSRLIDEADAFVLVTPEYNYSFPAALKNALDYLYNEWQEKPVAFVSYGGLSGGMRAVQALKLPLTTLGMMPLAQAVNIPFFSKQISEEGIFEANESQGRSAKGMLSTLHRWTKGLAAMRSMSVAEKE